MCIRDRAKDVIVNICDFIMSYTFDDSDPMTDYFHTNFYLTLGIGSYKQPYKVCLLYTSSRPIPHPEGHHPSDSVYRK